MSLRSWSVRCRRTPTSSIQFSAKRSAYCGMPSDASHSAIVDTRFPQTVVRRENDTAKIGQKKMVTAVACRARRQSPVQADLQIFQAELRCRQPSRARGLLDFFEAGWAGRLGGPAGLDRTHFPDPRAASGQQGERLDHQSRSLSTTKTTMPSGSHEASLHCHDFLPFLFIVTSSELGCSQAVSSSSSVAPLSDRVSNPSVNEPYTGARSSRAPLAPIAPEPRHAHCSAQFP